MMAGTFLNLNDDDQEEASEPKIGAGLKRKKKGSRPRADAEAVAAAGRKNGFNRYGTFRVVKRICYLRKLGIKEIKWNYIRGIEQ